MSEQTMRYAAPTWRITKKVLFGTAVTLLSILAVLALWPILLFWVAGERGWP